jgi:undecaprenyl pyrophosphate phosphatase UppP
MADISPYKHTSGFRGFLSGILALTCRKFVKMLEGIRELTATINVFVRFFESINCLFWQIDWLRRNFSSSTPNDYIVIVLVIICICIYATFFNNNDMISNFIPYLKTNVLNILVAGLLIGLMGWLLYHRFCKRPTADSREDMKNRDIGNEYSPLMQGEPRFISPIEQVFPGPGYRGNRDHLRFQQV